MSEITAFILGALVAAFVVFAWEFVRAWWDLGRMTALRLVASRRVSRNAVKGDGYGDERWNLNADGTMTPEPLDREQS